MKQQIRSMLDGDDRGVSPVIGVILMVAITVILAAVIGTFVLGLGGDLQQTPQSQLSIEAGDSTGNVEISHNGGDTLQWENLNVEVDTGDTYTSSSGEFSVGQSVDWDTTNGDGTDVTVQVIHTPSETILVENTVTV